MERIKFRDCRVLRVLLFIVLPIIVLICAAAKPSSYVTGLIINVGIYALLCASLNLVNGFSGMFSMGHAAFMCIGAYVSAFFTVNPNVLHSHCKGLPAWIADLTLPFPVALLIGGLAAALVSLVIAFPVVRTKGHYLSVATLALIVVVKAVVDNEDQLTNGSRGLTGLQKPTIWLVYVVMMVCLFVMYRLMRSAYGRGLTAMRDDPVAAQTLGINLVSKKLSVFAFSAFFAGVGGGLFGHYLTAISSSAFYFSKSFDIVEISIIGGMSSLSGSILGAIFFTILPTFLQPLENGGLVIFGVQLPQMFGLANIIMAVILILLVIFRRQGLMGNSEIILDTWFQKESYRALLRREEWAKLPRYFRDLPARIRDGLRSGKGAE